MAQITCLYHARATSVCSDWVVTAYCRHIFNVDVEKTEVQSMLLS